MKLIRRIIILTIMFCIQIFTVHSQLLTVTGSETLLAKLRLNETLNGIESILYSDVVGNPYLYKDFKEANLVMTTGESIPVLIRYDIYADEMHLKDKDQIYAIIHPEKVTFIETDSIKFIFSHFSKSAGNGILDDTSFFIVRAEGKCMLLIRKNLRVQDPEPPTLYKTARPAKFIPTSDSYYLKMENLEPVLIRNNKDILSVLKDQDDSVSLFIKTNKVSIKKEADLISLINYYNNL